MTNENNNEKFEEKIRRDFVSSLPKVNHFKGDPMNDFTGTDKSTISESTIKQYEKKGQTLFFRFLKDSGQPDVTRPDEVSLVQFVHWFVKGNGGMGAEGRLLSKSTYRLYRASCWWFLRNRGTGASDFEEACALLKEDSYNTSRNYFFERSRTTARRMKKFPEEDFAKVIEWLETARRIHISNAMIFFLKASILTGLRPHEWQYSRLYETADSRGRQRIILAVPNSKHSNGRATGDARLIDVTDFDGEDIEVIKKNLFVCERWRDKWLAKERNMANVMKQINMELWPRRKKVYMLYSCRHQAIANFKRVYDRETIAAIVGHGSNNTAGEHYGRRKVGSSSVRSLPKPVEGELNMALRRQHDLFVEREVSHMDRIQEAQGAPEGNAAPAGSSSRTDDRDIRP